MPEPPAHGRLAIIAALARNRVIGAGNRLPWRLPEDLKRFKALTLGHPVVMGRKTWESIGRPLPGRRNLVITRDPGFRAEGAEVFGSIAEALSACSGKLAFVIGGAQIYAEAVPLADLMHLTEIDADFEGDALFPDFDRSRWRETLRERRVSAEGLRFDFVDYERRPA